MGGDGIDERRLDGAGGVWAAVPPSFLWMLLRAPLAAFAALRFNLFEYRTSVFAMLRRDESNAQHRTLKGRRTRRFLTLNSQPSTLLKASGVAYRLCRDESGGRR